MKKTIKLHDRTFRPLIPQVEIDEAISRVASRIAADYAGRGVPLFVGVLNGSFMYASELMKRMEFPLEVSFVKLASYSGTCSTGCVSELIGLESVVEGRHVVVVEDIIDTGNTIDHIMSCLCALRPASVELTSLVFKPKAYTKPYPVKYPAIEAGNEFIIGFGLDYNGLGRNLRDIYVAEDEE